MTYVLRFIKVNNLPYAELIDGTLVPVLSDDNLSPDNLQDGSLLNNKLVDGSIPITSPTPLQTSSVSAGTSGSNIAVSQITCNNKGIITGRSTNTLRSANNSQSGIVPSYRGWTEFSGASITSGAGNLSITDYYWARVGDTVYIQGRVSAGSGGGSSSDELRVNMPVNNSGGNTGCGVFRRSGGIANRIGIICSTIGNSNLRFSRPLRLQTATTSDTDDAGYSYSNGDSGYLNGNNMTTGNGEVWFFMAYRAASSIG